MTEAWLITCAACDIHQTRDHLDDARLLKDIHTTDGHMAVLRRFESA